jgi:dTDP-4-amino-4,6-dideoxygalactose transaminase
MEDVARFASSRGIAVIEDCAQSHGASIAGRRTGSFGAAAAFSFYPTKNLGALGDGGAVVTNDAAVAERVRLLRQYGWQQRYVSETRGWNSRLDELQAAVLRVKLRYLDAENERRRSIAMTYSDALRETDVTPPFVAPDCAHVYHQFVVRAKRREACRRALSERGIDTAVLYPVPIHRQPAYRDLRHAPLPVTESIAGEIFSIPLFAHLEQSEIDRVVAALRLLE